MKFLLTQHGTLVQYDVAKEEYRHAGILQGTENVSFLPSADAKRGELFAFHPDGGAKLFARPATSEALPSGQCSLRIEDMTLVAHPDGRIALERVEPTAAPGFWLLSKEQLAGLKFIASHRWLSDSTSDEPIRPGSVEIGDKLVIGGLVYPIAAVLTPTHLLAEAIERKSFAITYDEWKISRFRLFNPIVYYSAFGNPSIFDCLELAIQSLFEFGAWDGPIAIITDKEHIDFSQRFAEPIRDKIQIRVMDCRDVLDYTLSRYRIPFLQGLNQYTPLIYLDTDVVCNAPFQSLPLSLVRGQDVHFCAEHPVIADKDSYGISLLLGDSYRPHAGERGFSTGLMAFRDVADVAELFAQIVACSYAFARVTDNRHHFETYDQPFANYVLRKLGGFNTSVLTNYSVTYGPDHRVDHTRRCGFAHFAGGVGRAAPKLQRMQDYVHHLRGQSNVPSSKSPRVAAVAML